MSKKNRKNQNSSRPQQNHSAPLSVATPPSVIPSLNPPTENAAASRPAEQPLAEQVAKLEEAALLAADDADLAAAAEIPEPSEASLDELCRRAKEAYRLLEAQRKRLEEEQAALTQEQERLRKADDVQQKRAEDLAEQGRTLGDKQRNMEEQRTLLAAQLHDSEIKARRLLDQEEALRKRELNAEAGFAAERRQSLEQLEKEAAVLRVELSAARARRLEEEKAHHDRLDRARTDSDTEQRAVQERLKAEEEKRRTSLEEQLQEMERAHNTNLDQARAQFAEAQVALRAEQVKLGRDLKQLAFDRTLLNEDRGDLDVLVEQRSAAALEKLKHEIAALEHRLVTAREDRDRLDARLQRREEADLRFGEKTPEEILTELDSLRAQRDAQRDELSRRPDEQTAQRLRELEKQEAAWDAERRRLTEENLTLKRDLSLRDIAVTELETLRDHRNVLDARVKLAQQHLSELRSDVEQRIASASGRSPFPACRQMDEDGPLQSEALLSERKLELAALVEELRHRMALDPGTEKRLYYAARDVRCFLGGLAMSKLHLLQGVSGTGKTSLPLAFARAIGAGSKLIEVQAGWRDRQDLIGHFNAFDRRFHETEFLKALYRAQCPQLKGRPFIIVLDEMNLSHPEQYGADLLSALEQDAHLQRLHLLPAALDDAAMPKLFVDRSALAIPSNVWFVGTANHDETTRDFADKTYDRAHVMELPRGRDPFTPEKLPPPEPLSITALQRAFTRAQQEHKEAAQRSFEFITEQLTEPLAKRFRIGWGNRLERQLDAFVPVVVAAGGSLSEATDHIISTKLLRKLRDRHDTRLEDVRQLRQELAKAWPVFTKKKGDTLPRSFEILDAELTRLGGEAEAAA